jgi:Helix-turn-helix domain
MPLMGSQKRNSQTSRALNLLRTHRGQWVAAYLVAQVAGLQYGSRIHTLRQRGYVISNRVEHHDGQTLGWFRLESEPNQFQKLHEPNSESGPATLFPDWKGAHVDDG